MSPSRSPLRLAACLFPCRQPGSAGAGPVEPCDGKESGEAQRGGGGGGGSQGLGVSIAHEVNVPWSLLKLMSASSCSPSSILAPSKKAKVEPDLETRRAAVRSAALSDIFAIMEKEMQFQVKGIELITTLNSVCCIVLKTLVSHLIDKYYGHYGWNQCVSQIEQALLWSWLHGILILISNASFVVCIGLLFPGRDPIVELDCPSYGHVGHHHYMPNGKKLFEASMFSKSLSYEVNLLIGCIDHHDKLEKKDIGLRSQKMLVRKQPRRYSREWEFDGGD